jgi:hypothetical protein
MAPQPPPSHPTFDPYHSSSTGHQRAGNRFSGSASWRHSRTRKLAYQFGDGTGGGGAAHVSDLVDPGSGTRDIREMMQKAETKEAVLARAGRPDSAGPPATAEGPLPRPIFAGLTIYLDGSTLPHVSDHRLKHELVQHGAAVATALRRRTVTHVILGERGGLAAGKVQKEVARTRGAGIKFVGVRWALDSIEKGTRQAERRYEVVRLATAGQRRLS